MLVGLAVEIKLGIRASPYVGAASQRHDCRGNVGDDARVAHLCFVHNEGGNINELCCNHVARFRNVEVERVGQEAKRTMRGAKARGSL